MWREWDEPPTYVTLVWVNGRYQVQSDSLVVRTIETYHEVWAWLDLHGYKCVAANLYERNTTNA